MREETNKHNQKEGRKERKCEQKYRTQGACKWLILFAFCFPFRLELHHELGFGTQMLFLLL
jgi:hypothetical protein